MAGDPKLVFQIRKGRDARPLMAAKITAYMDRVERELGLPPIGDRARRRR